MKKQKMIRFSNEIHREILLERAINPDFDRVQDVAEAATVKGLEQIRKERETGETCQKSTK